MKKYISYLLASALLAPVFVSCNERLQEEEIPVRTHKVLFSASQAETRTGLSIEGKTVTPDWNKTDESSIHLFETDANNATVYGETLIIKMSSDNKETAQFEADFPENMTIAVGVNDDTSTGGSAARVAPYSYTAVVAQKAAGETLAFVIPAEQHPDAETLKDPNADFLVGYGAEKVDAPHNYDEPVVDLYFDRAAAMGRVAISNFSDNGEKVQSVTISTTAGLTGSAALSAIDFEKATVSFTRTEGPLSLVYDNGADVPADGTFYAYFVAIPGEATISSIEVVTDQYVYTKEIGKASTFSAKSFKNFTLDLSTAEKQSVAPAVTSYTKVTSTSELEAGAQYILVYETASKAFKPILHSGGTYFTKSTANALDVTIVDGEIQSSDLEECLITLEEGYYLFIESANKYLYPGASGDSALGAEDKTSGHTVAISFSSGIVTIARSGDSNYHLYWSSSNYFSGINSNQSNYAANICLYKLDDGRQKQSPSFTADSAEYDLYTGKWTKEVPTLNDARGTVTYESSDPAVAAVDASTGAVTPITKGTATITAKAAGNATYRPGEASYTVKVVDSNPNVPKYYKVEEIEAGQTYIIVSEGQAMTMNGTTLGFVSVTDVDGVIETDEDLALWTAAEHVEYYSGTSAAGHFTLKNGDNYLQRYSNSGTQTASVGGVPSTGKYYVWEYDGTHLYHLSSASNTFYLGYSSGWKFNYQSPYYTASLYSTTKQQTKLTQSISFSTSDAKYDKATSAWTVAVPTLSGAQTDVTFSSSNEAVATVSKVDNTTVNVTIASGAKKNDTAVITATAEGTETYKSASASFTVTVDDSNSKTPEYALVESDSDIEVGAKYLLVNESNSKVFKPVLNGSNFTSAAANALSATIQNHTIVSDEFEACELALEEGYYFFVESANRYLYPTSSSIGAEETKSSSHSFSISIASDGIATISRTSNNSTYKLRWTSSGYFQSSTSSANCQLYKLQENGPKKRNLAFSPTSVSVNIYGKSTPIVLSELTTVPTLSGNGLNDVTYSIDPSTSNVAEVTAAGVVTVKNTGTVTIKASAGATPDYQADSATYTLTVTSTAVQTYTKATEVSVSDSYLIVSVADDKVFNGKIKTGENAISIEKPTSNTIEDAEGNFAAYVFTFEKDGDSYYLKFNDGKYLVCDYGQNTGADTGTGLLYKEKKSDVKYPYTLTINNGAFFFKTSQETAGTGNQYMYYKTDSSGSGPLSFKIGGSGSNVGIHLYKKN